jgi:hypothetical protein
MTDPVRTAALSDLLETAAAAHHDVTGGLGHDWAEWYAEFVADEIEGVLGFDPGADRLARWLRAVAARHGVEAADRPWPEYYAEVIVDMVESNRADP